QLRGERRRQRGGVGGRGTLSQGLVVGGQPGGLSFLRRGRFVGAHNGTLRSWCTVGGKGAGSRCGPRDRALYFNRPLRGPSITQFADRGYNNSAAGGSWPCPGRSPLRPSWYPPTGCLFYACQDYFVKTMPAHSLRKVIGDIRPSLLPDVHRSTLPS